MQSFVSGGRTIRLDVHEPAAHEPAAPKPAAPTRAAQGRHPAILLLHGAGGNAGFWLDRIGSLVKRFGVGLYAAHYFDRTGTVRAGPEHLADGIHVPQWLETIADARSSIAARPTVDPTRIALLGISLGAFLAPALATRPSTPPLRAVVEISGGLVAPFEQQATTAFPPTLIVHGEADSVVPVTYARSLDQRLRALQVPHQLHLLPGEGHWFSPLAQAAILQSVAVFLGRHLALVPWSAPRQ